MNELNILFEFLSRNQKKKLIILFFLLLIGMLLEIIGLGILLPIISVILDFEKFEYYIESYEVLAFLMKFNYNQIVTYSLGLIILIYFLKNIFLIFLNFQINKFQNILSSDVSTRLFKNFLKSNFNFHLENKPSDLVKNLQIDINYFTAYFAAIFFGVTEIFLVLSILVSLIIIQPIGTIIIFCFITFMSYIFYKISNVKIAKWSKIRAVYDNDLIKIYIESLDSIREVILSTKSSYFSSKVKSLNNTRASISTKQATLRQVPRYYLEFLSICGIIFLIFYLTNSGNSVEKVIATVGVFTAATFRILPSTNRILQSLQTLKFYQNSVTVIRNRFIELNNDYQNDEIKLNSKIELNNVDYVYPKSTKIILKNLNLQIQKNETIGIVGTSGSGKSTIVDLISGLIKPTKGEILIDNKLLRISNNNWKAEIGYVNQLPSLFDATIKENIALGIENSEIDMIKIKQAIRDSDLDEFVLKLDQKENYLISEKGSNLSGGQRQRIAIARALYKNASILILDEATSALDKESESKIFKTIKKLKGTKTIIIISHKKDNLKICDKIYNLDI
jgi:ATP-binding cassette, subfamily B, bacterial PglK